MKVKELIRQLQNLKEGMEDKDILIIAPNGLKVPPTVHLWLNEKYNIYDKSVENTKAIILDYQ